MYDVIGDIHGHAAELVHILELLGYECVEGVYRHPTRRVIFLGDFIDRGDEIAQTLAIVRPMVDAGAALSVMGNHEFNALAFHTPDPRQPGDYLRPHTVKNIHQHRETLDQLSPTALAHYLDWFRTLPLWLDLDGLRVVHACWDNELLQVASNALGGVRRVSNAFLQQACDSETELFIAVDAILKGKEAALPNGHSFLDEDGHPRHAIRAKWYLSPAGQEYSTYALQSAPVACSDPLPQSVVEAARPYPTDAKPVFVGHYWLKAQRPEILASNIACVDYSVAKGGMLCAYRWSGEQTLDNANFVTVPAR